VGQGPGYLKDKAFTIGTGTDLNAINKLIALKKSSEPIKNSKTSRVP
jgi:hypothetical protein